MDLEECASLLQAGSTERGLSMEDGRACVGRAMSGGQDADREEGFRGQRRFRGMGCR